MRGIYCCDLHFSGAEMEAQSTQKSYISVDCRGPALTRVKTDPKDVRTRVRPAGGKQPSAGQVIGLGVVTSLHLVKANVRMTRYFLLKKLSAGRRIQATA